MAGKMKSPNYPAVGLREAIESVRRLWDAEKRTPVDARTAVGAMGYGALSGSAAVRLSALRKYGLVESDGKGVRVSQLAMKILHTPDGSAEQRAAIREAAQKPELFRELASTHAEASDQALRSYLMVQKGFSDSGAINFIAAFRDTLGLIGSSSLGYHSDNSEEVTPMPGTTHEIALGNSVKPADSVTLHASTKGSGQTHLWALSKDTSAELRFSATRLTKAEAERLRQYLELTISALTVEDPMKLD